MQLNRSPKEILNPLFFRHLEISLQLITHMVRRLRLRQTRIKGCATAPHLALLSKISIPSSETVTPKTLTSDMTPRKRGEEEEEESGVMGNRGEEEEGEGAEEIGRTDARSVALESKE